jgi:hypothetical protein
MKRILALAAAMIICAGCGEKAAFAEEDLCLDIGGTKYFLHTDVAEVIDDLGAEYEYSEAISCDYEGLDKSFLYDVAEFYTYPRETADMLMEIYTEDSQVETSKGLRVGAAKSDVFEQYGDDCEDTGYQLVYALDKGSLCFDLENDAVTAIYVTNRVL